MLTKDRISMFYEDVKSLGLKRPVAAITKATGYSKGNVSQYLSGKDEPSENFIDRFYEVFKDSFKKVPHGTISKSINGQPNTLAAEIASPEPLDNGTLLRILDNLSAAHREISESNNKLADNEKIILMKMPTVGSHGESPSDEYATLQGVRGLLIEFYADVKKTTLQEAESVLGTKVVAAKKKVGKKDILSDAGK